MLRSNRFLGGLLGGLVVAFLLATPVMGAQGGSVTMRTGQSFENSYPPIIGMFPNPVGGPGLQGCRDSQACHVIDVHYAPDGLKGYVGRLEITWPDPTEGGNDIDVWLYDSNGEDVDHSASSVQPERIVLADTQPGLYHLAVVNWVGANSGYTVKGSLTYEPVVLPPRTKREAPKSEAPAVPAVTAPKVAPLGPGPVVVAPAPVPDEIVRRPGADGPESGYPLAAVPSSSQARTGERGIPAGDIARYLVMGLVTIGGLVVVGSRIRSDLRST